MMSARELANAEQSDVCQLAGDPDKIEQTAAAVGLTVIRIDLKRLAGKAGFLGRAARALKFPDWFGKNWDALNDCLTDLSWLNGRGWVIIFENSKDLAARKPQVFHSAVEVFQAANDYWRQTGKPFWVLFHGPSDWVTGLDRFEEY
jgi:RNAse (barnase) inhibitor barstar